MLQRKDPGKGSKSVLTSLRFWYYTFNIRTQFSLLPYSIFHCKKSYCCSNTYCLQIPTFSADCAVAVGERDTFSQVKDSRATGEEIRGRKERVSEESGRFEQRAWSRSPSPLGLWRWKQHKWQHGNSLSSTNQPITTFCAHAIDWQTNLQLAGRRGNSRERVRKTHHLQQRPFPGDGRRNRLRSVRRLPWCGRNVQSPARRLVRLLHGVPEFRIITTDCSNIRVVVFITVPRFISWIIQERPFCVLSLRLCFSLDRSWLCCNHVSLILIESWSCDLYRRVEKLRGTL